MAIIKGNAKLPKTFLNGQVGLTYNCLTNGLKQPQLIASTDNSGNYTLEVPISEPTEVQLFFAWNKLRLILFPGDEVNINIDEATLLNWQVAPYQIKGDHKALNSTTSS